jgi:4-alpha-glucanotransferase
VRPALRNFIVFLSAAKNLLFASEELRRVLVYERHWHGDGRSCLPHEYPQQALAMLATHDMPTMAEYWQGGDIARRERLAELMREAGRSGRSSPA